MLPMAAIFVKSVKSTGSHEQAEAHSKAGYTGEKETECRKTILQKEVFEGLSTRSNSICQPLFCRKETAAAEAKATGLFRHFLCVCTQKRRTEDSVVHVVHW